MKVMVTGRQGGKTSAMIQWMLNGHSINHYPYWSRVIVCPSITQVMYFSKRLREATDDLDEDERWVWDLRKAVWCVDDLVAVGKHHGIQDIEIGIDDAEMFISRLLTGQRLSFMTLTGELVDQEP